VQLQELPARQVRLAVLQESLAPQVQLQELQVQLAQRARLVVSVPKYLCLLLV
jgi:hypothetical protein